MAPPGSDGSPADSPTPVDLQLLLEGACRRSCAHCYISDQDGIERSLTVDEVADNLAYWAGGSLREVVLAGGEITDRPDLPEILDLLAKIDVERITIVSRGHRWNQPGLLERATNLPLTIVWSFDVWVAKDVDPEMPHHSLGRALATMSPLRDAGVKLATNTVLTSSFVRLMPRSGQALADLPAEYSTLTYPFPAGRARSGGATVVPPLSAALDVVDALAVEFDRVERPWALKGLPVCWAPQWREQIHATKNRHYVTSSRQRAAAGRYLPDQLPFAHVQACVGCEARHQCDGVWPTRLGDRSFPPIQAIVG